MEQKNIKYLELTGQVMRYSKEQKNMAELRSSLFTFPSDGDPIVLPETLQRIFL